MWSRIRLLAVVTGAVLLWGMPVMAQEAITMVEEEWELQIGTPKPVRSSPQLACVMSTCGDLSSTYAVFAVNQRNGATTSEGGGMQLQLWQGGVMRSSVSGANTASLSNVGERITWTQRMSIKNGVLTVEVLSGISQTWSKFGKGELVLSTSTGLTDLNAYDPNVTTANTGITFGEGCVDKLTLKKVRLYTGNQKSVEQALDRVVYQHE